MRLKFTIERYSFPRAKSEWQTLYLWRCTLPNGASKVWGAVSLFSINDLLVSRSVREWATREVSGRTLVVGA